MSSTGEYVIAAIPIRRQSGHKLGPRLPSRNAIRQFAIRSLPLTYTQGCVPSVVRGSTYLGVLHMFQRNPSYLARGGLTGFRIVRMQDETGGACLILASVQATDGRFIPDSNSPLSWDDRLSGTVKIDKDVNRITPTLIVGCREGFLEFWLSRHGPASLFDRGLVRRLGQSSARPGGAGKVP